MVAICGVSKSLQYRPFKVYRETFFDNFFLYIKKFSYLCNLFSSAMYSNESN